MALKTEDQEVMAEYPYIVACGIHWGSDGWYVLKECYEAKSKNAPKNTYTFKNGKPVTIDEIANPDYKESLEACKNGTKGGYLRHF